MATHSGILARRTPWAEKPGGLHGVAEELGLTEQQQLGRTVSMCKQCSNSIL